MIKEGTMKLLTRFYMRKHAAPATTFTASTQAMRRMPQLKPPPMPGQLMKPRGINANSVQRPTGARPPVPAPVIPSASTKISVPPPSKSFGGQQKPGRVLS
jgi:hypothetical protein